jgi:hypothetical protein
VLTERRAPRLPAGCQLPRLTPEPPCAASTALEASAVPSSAAPVPAFSLPGSAPSVAGAEVAVPASSPQEEECAAPAAEFAAGVRVGSVSVVPVGLAEEESAGLWEDGLHPSGCWAVVVPDDSRAEMAHDSAESVESVGERLGVGLGRAGWAADSLAGLRVGPAVEHWARSQVGRVVERWARSRAGRPCWASPVSPEALVSPLGARRDHWLAASFALRFLPMVVQDALPKPAVVSQKTREAKEASS